MSSIRLLSILQDVEPIVLFFKSEYDFSTIEDVPDSYLVSVSIKRGEFLYQLSEYYVLKASVPWTYKTRVFNFSTVISTS
jgi:hypothetical protein